jgi:cytochrome c peroxidase
MSPEQMRSLKLADGRSDIWSLGVILYELISGRRPFQGDSLPASLLRIGFDPPAPFPRGAAPPGLEAAVVRCLDKDRARRPQTIAELGVLLAPFGGPGARASLERILECRPPVLRTEPPTVQQSASPATFMGPAWGLLAETRTALAPVPTRSRPRRLLWLFGVAAAISGLVAVRTLVAGPNSSDIDADRLASFAPLPVDAAPAGAVDRRRVELGRRLFADPRLSKGGDIACATCHPLDRYGVDGKKLSRGSDDREPPRNTLSVYNTAGFFALLWDGRKEDLVEQAKEVLLSPRAMAARAEALPVRLRALPDYAGAFAAAFPDDAEAVTFDNIARALAAFEATLFSRGRWDRFLEGGRSALTDEEKAGFNRFVEIGCVTCHFGPNVGATMFQKLGLVKAWSDSRDRGRFEITRRDVDWMVFRVPTLRNVEKTGPYFHDGSVSDLDTAIELMARHQLGKEIDARDVRLIRSWLVSLTGDPRPSP